jgi:hypothetical protein
MVPSSLLLHPGPHEVDLSERFATERKEPRMDRRTMWIAGGTLALAVVGGGAGIALGAGDGDDEPLTGSALDQASTAAVEHTGGGAVTEAEVGDDGAAYGVEIRLVDGSTVEVSLDANFNVIDQEADDDGPDENTGPDDD